MNVWRLIDTGSASAAENMAKDEMLLREAGQSGALPVLRFYAWSPAAVSLGRFQDEAASVNVAACRRQGIDIVRRITGGRAVFHNRELTYSVVAPIGCGMFPNDVLGTYKVIAGGLLAGLRILGVPAEMVAEPRKQVAPAKAQEPACFSAPSSYEIVVHGRKIVGSAQRRVSAAFLQHGSILLDYDPDLEAELIPGAGLCDAVTSITQVMGAAVPLETVKKAVQQGFTEALQVEFKV